MRCLARVGWGRDLELIVLRNISAHRCCCVHCLQCDFLCVACLYFFLRISLKGSERAEAEKLPLKLLPLYLPVEHRHSFSCYFRSGDFEVLLAAFWPQEFNGLLCAAWAGTGNIPRWSLVCKVLSVLCSWSSVSRQSLCSSVVKQCVCVWLCGQEDRENLTFYCLA